jgi:hypothetical protein
MHGVSVSSAPCVYSLLRNGTDNLLFFLIIQPSLFQTLNLLMTVFHLHSSDELTTLPLSEVTRDWNGTPVTPSPRFVFAIDETHFHFRAMREGSSIVHPNSCLGSFQAELWKFDVAEFFLRDPNSNHYLEINLAPNGGWWSCLFSAPLVRLTEREEPAPDVTVEASCDDQGWDARISIPLSYLQEKEGFSPDSRLHGAFLLGSPQHCLTSGPIPPGDPNFHHPDLPQPINIIRP